MSKPKYTWTSNPTDEDVRHALWFVIGLALMGFTATYADLAEHMGDRAAHIGSATTPLQNALRDYYQTNGWPHLNVFIVKADGTRPVEGDEAWVAAERARATLWARNQFPLPTGGCVRLAVSA